MFLTLAISALLTTTTNGAPGVDSRHQMKPDVQPDQKRYLYKQGNTRYKKFLFCRF